jgi:hypothetical protein
MARMNTHEMEHGAAAEHRDIAQRMSANYAVAHVRSGAQHHSGDPAAAAGPRVTYPRPAGGEPVPIWLAVLMATSCEAKTGGEKHDVRWNCVAGRAVYKNSGCAAERIEPLGVSLLGGQTLAVSWVPGATAYTVEVFGQED